MTGSSALKNNACTHSSSCSGNSPILGCWMGCGPLVSLKELRRGILVGLLPSPSVVAGERARLLLVWLVLAGADMSWMWSGVGLDILFCFYFYQGLFICFFLRKNCRWDGFGCDVSPHTGLKQACRSTTKPIKPEGGLVLLCFACGLSTMVNEEVPVINLHAHPLGSHTIFSIFTERRRVVQFRTFDIFQVSDRPKFWQFCHTLDLLHKIVRKPEEKSKHTVRRYAEPTTATFGNCHPTIKVLP